MTLTVACVLRSGGVYGPEWVQKLRAGVAANLSCDHRFVCLSDMMVEGVETLSLRHEYPRWWAKIELFEPGLFTGPTLYLDLDSIVVGPLDDLFEFEGFRMCRDFLNPKVHNSSVMAWHKDMSAVYDAFRVAPDDMMKRYDRERPRGRIGDQAFIEDHAGEIRVFAPEQVVSYRQSALHGPPGTASIVTFHGRPKPPDAVGWAQEQWRSLPVEASEW